MHLELSLSPAVPYGIQNGYAVVDDATAFLTHKNRVSPFCGAYPLKLSEYEVSLIFQNGVALTTELTVAQNVLDALFRENPEFVAL